MTGKSIKIKNLILFQCESIRSTDGGVSDGLLYPIMSPYYDDFLGDSPGDMGEEAKPATPEPSIKRKLSFEYYPDNQLGLDVT